MKPEKSRIIFGVVLVLLSALFYFIHYLTFHDPHHLFIFLVGDIAFVFIEVLLVSMIIHELLSYREKKSMLQKMNMVIGAFFSEVGDYLLRSFSSCDKNAGTISAELASFNNWSEKEFTAAKDRLGNVEYRPDCTPQDLSDLKTFLVGKRTFLLNLLQNPNLLEHESFTNLLWAVFHLMEELDSREDVEALTTVDMSHIANDMRRAYTLLIREWLQYMKHLKGAYPYLFSLAVRTNPFDPDASPEVTG